MLKLNLSGRYPEICHCELHLAHRGNGPILYMRCVGLGACQFVNLTRSSPPRLTRVCIDAKIVTSLTSPTSAVKWNLAEGFLVDLDIKENGNVCTLKLKGKLVSGEAVSQFESAFLNALSGGHIFLILDLEDVPFVDSSGIGSIVNSLRTSSKAGGTVKLVKPAGFVQKMLKMVGVLDLFEVFDSEKDAAATLAGS